MTSPVIAALGTAFAPAGATAATVAATGTSVALSVGGSVLAGAAGAWMEKKAAEEEEERQVREEERLTNSYEGISDAVSFDEKPRLRFASEKISEQPALGQPKSLGDVYRVKAQQARGTRQPKYRYNRETGTLEH